MFSYAFVHTSSASSSSSSLNILGSSCQWLLCVGVHVTQKARALVGGGYMPYMVRGGGYILCLLCARDTKSSCFGRVQCVHVLMTLESRELTFARHYLTYCEHVTQKAHALVGSNWSRS
jgi:hypothetical protein